MANLDDGIKFGDFSFANSTTQIGGEDAKTEKINYSDGLTQAELKRLDKNNDGTVTENEFVEVCLEDEDETSGIKSKKESELRTIFQKYFKAFSESTSSKSTGTDDTTEEDEVEVSVKLKANSNLPESLTFGPYISITDIKTGDKEGEYFSEMKMDGKTYKKTSSNKNHSGIETYVLEPEPKDGSKIVIEKYADGTQYYRVYNTGKKAISELELDKDGKEKSIFRYKDGYAYEREYLQRNCVRRYERDENHKLTSSKDYQKDSKGNIDESKPVSMQTYEYLEEIGAQWKTRVLYEYDENGNQKVKETHVYGYDQKKDSNGELTGEMITTRKVYSGDSQNDEDLLFEEIMKYLEGLLNSSETNEKGKKTTKVKYNSDGSTTTTITEGNKKTVIKKDKYGEIQSKKVTENGKTTTTLYENGEEKETVDGDVDTDGYPDNVKGVLAKIKMDNMPDDIKEVISLVSDTFENGNNATEGADTQDREKEEGETSNEYKSATTNESGSQVTYTSGKQEFPDRTNTYTEIYEGDSIEGKQLGGFGIVEYKNGEFEIHYDKFKDGKVDEGKGIIINEEDETITLYITDSNGKTTEKTYKFDGTEVK